jgi:hypothetical protein
MSHRHNRHVEQEEAALEQAQHQDDGRGFLRGTERQIEGASDSVWRVFRRRPYMGVALLAAAGFGLATWLGPGEVAAAVAAGYVGYLVLRRRVPPSKAFAHVFTRGRIGAPHETAAPSPERKSDHAAPVG